MSILDKSSLVMIPSGYKEDVLYSVKPRNGEGDFTFTRASTGTRVNADGYIEEVPWNLVTNSNDLSYLSTSNVIKTTNAITSPIGSNDGISVVNTNNYGNLFKTNVTIKKDSNFTQSVYVKPFSTSFIYMRALSFDNDMFCWFDLENVSVGTDAYNIGSIEQAEDGWVRCSITFTSTTNLTGRLYLYATSADNQIAQTGDSVYYWGLQYNHGSPKPYIKTTDRLDIPRLDYSGGATTPTLLLEPQRTNEITYSEDYSQSYWRKDKLTATANSATSPSGLMDAFLIQETTYTNSIPSFDLQNSNTLSAGTYTFSFYVKNNNGRYLGISFGSSGERVRTNFDFNTNTFKTLYLSGSTTGSASYTTLGDYYRISITATFSSSIPADNVLMPLETDTYPYFAFQDSDNRSFYLWGMQVEEGSYATSYIPTNGTSVTRTNDKIPSQTLDTALTTEGTIYIDFDKIIQGGADYGFINSSNQNSYKFYFYGGGMDIYNGAAFIVDRSTLEPNNSKVAVSWNGTDVKVFINGNDRTKSGAVASANNTEKISFNDVSDICNMNAIILFTEQLTDEELTTLTTI